jgi:hypothetical protein
VTTDYGSDINTPGGADLDPWFATIAGPEAVLQVCVRRLMTPRGSLPDDPGFGYDLRAHANDHAPNATAIAAAAEDQLARDERVLRATATVTFTASTETLAVSIRVTLAEGTFRLVLEVSAVTVSVLSTEAA